MSRGSALALSCGAQARLLHQLRNLETRSTHELGMLKSRNDQLHAQVTSLKATTARGRQKLYWTSLQASGGPESGTAGGVGGGGALDGAGRDMPRPHTADPNGADNPPSPPAWPGAVGGGYTHAAASAARGLSRGSLSASASSPHL